MHLKAPNLSKHDQRHQNRGPWDPGPLELRILSLSKSSKNPSPSPTFILNHFPLLATCVHSLLDNFGQVWTSLEHLDAFGHVLTHLDAFGRIWTGFGQVWTGFGRVWKVSGGVWRSLEEFEEVLK